MCVCVCVAEGRDQECSGSSDKLNKMGVPARLPLFIDTLIGEVHSREIERREAEGWKRRQSKGRERTGEERRGASRLN